MPGVHADLPRIPWIEPRPIFKRLQLWQILRSLRVDELAAAQPASFKPIPELNRVHLPGELVDTPQATITNSLAGRIERNAVQLAQRVDFVPVRPDVAVLERDVIGAAWFPPITAAARVEAVPLHQEFRQPRDGVRDAPGFVGCQMLVAPGPFLQIVP